MAGVYVNDEGTWKLPKSIWVKSGTSTTGSTGWRVCRNVYIRYDGKWFEMMKTVDLTTSQQNFNLYEFVGSPTEPFSLIFNIDSGVEISSLGVTGGYRTTAFTVGNFPTGSTVIVNNNGYISGGGGDRGLPGGYGAGTNYNPNGGNGGNGGYGLVKGSNNNFDCTIVNTGTIAGGGGGGGGGAGIQASNASVKGGHGGQGSGITGFSKTQGEIGQPGPQGIAIIVGGQDKVVYSGAGGNGGSNSESGTDGLKSPDYIKGAFGGSGGQGRAAILGNGIEIAVSGNIDGSIG